MNEEKKLATDIAVRYIAKNYAPIGSNERIEHMTSADIVRELSEMVTLSIAEVSELMDKAGFKTEFISGKPYWVVYMK